ncbi:MAG: septal ring lytic transglycosylase RlpA family protein, partial [Candidatus Kapaibacteriota bacterium]
KFDQNISTNIADYDISEFFYSQQRGKSSWYGRKFHNRRTASGEIYDMNKLTAAHRYFPFGTVLRVRNLQNGKVILVRVNDRGPFISNKIIDLSYFSARKLGSLGNSDVEIETLIPREEIDLPGKYFFGFSYDYPLVCLPEGKIELIKYFNDFDQAITFYENISEKFPDEFIYLFVPALKTSNDSKAFFIGVFKNSNNIEEKIYVKKLTL